MSIYVGYEIATGPTEGATKGAKALMSWYLGAYGDETDPRAANLGIFNPKRLGSGWSIHAEGRACDLGTAPYSEPPWGWEVAEFLRLNSAELGIQCIIFDRKIWSGSFPHDGWRDYGGSNPHTGHIHVELSWESAKSLTVARINQVASAGQGGGSGSVSDPFEEALMDLPTLRMGDGGEHVKTVQGLLLTFGYDLGRYGPRRNGIDGKFGPTTDRVVRAFQKSRKVKNSLRSDGSGDGIVGDYTRIALVRG